MTFLLPVYTNFLLKSTLRSLALSAGWPEPNLKWFKVESGGNLQELKNDDKHTINILLNHANILRPHVCKRYCLQYLRIENKPRMHSSRIGTHACENVTFPTSLRYAVGNNKKNCTRTPNCGSIKKIYDLLFSITVVVHIHTFGLINCHYLQPSHFSSFVTAFVLSSLRGSVMLDPIFEPH